jgi:3-oxoacyl-[acyl-carrier protein] reductase
MQLMSATPQNDTTKPSTASRVAIVTGASAGIGRRICERLAGKDICVVAVARSAAPLRELAESLASKGTLCLSVTADVSDPNELEHLVSEVMNRFGRIDILVNNAGVDCFSNFSQLATEQILQTIETNLTGAILLTRLVVPVMISQKSGAIINMASTAGKHGPAFGAVYGATKAGLIAFTQGLRGELLKQGISASVICPGFCRNGGIYDRIIAGTGRRTSLFVGGTTADDVASAVISAIESGCPEKIVNWPPMKPVFLFRDIFPRLGEKLILMVTRKFLQRAATLSVGAAADPANHPAPEPRESRPS